MINIQNAYQSIKGKQVIIGLDGVPFEMLQAFAHDGTMPNTAAIIQNSTFEPMQSSTPHISSVAWSSMITGQNPGEHGIFGFTELDRENYTYSFPNYNDLKQSPFWEQENTGKSVIINVPSTYPVHQMNGIHIAGFVAIDINKAVYPADFVPQLNDLNYKLDVNSSLATDSIDAFLDDAFQTLEARAAAARHLWKEEWDTYMLVITGTDRLCHFLFDAYEDTNHPHHDRFCEYFKEVDNLIGEIYSQIPDGAGFTMLSDHGFEAIKTEVCLNRLLIDNDFLTLEAGTSQLQGITSSSKAFVLDPGRVYLHTNEYVKGQVGEKDKQQILEDLITLFQELKYEGNPVIRNIHRKEDIYSGPYMDIAPDLILEEHPGFDLKAKPSSQEVFTKSHFTGKHSAGNAFIVRG